MSDARKMAEGLLARYDMTKPPFDPEFIAEREGVDVKFVKFNGEAAEQVHGFYDHGDCEIFVNATDSVEEKMFTIAHELGHHILHQEYSAGERYVPRLKVHVDTPEENQADEFAVALLAPVEKVRHYGTVMDDDELSSMFLVLPSVIAKAKAG